MPRPAVACSCVMIRSLAEVANPETAIFTGTIGRSDARGVPIQVDRWFWGVGSAPVVWLSSDSFGDGDSCRIERPPLGSSWLWVGSPTREGTLTTGSCTPSVSLATADGQAKLAEAAKAFAGRQPIAAPSDANPAEPPPAASPAAEARDRAAAMILGGLIAGSLALFGGLVLVARHSRRRAADPRDRRGL